MNDPVFGVFLTLIILGFALVVILIMKSLQRQPTRYARRRQTMGEFDEQMEIDLRLTYKRFKELYPFSKLTYEEYKKLQMERAFKRAFSSQQNKRMVR